MNACDKRYFPTTHLLPISIPCSEQEVCYMYVYCSVDHTVDAAFCVFRWYLASASCTVCLQMFPIMFHQVVELTHLMVPLQIEMFYCLIIDIFRNAENPDFGLRVVFIIKPLSPGPSSSLFYIRKHSVKTLEKICTSIFPFHPRDSFFICKMMELD